MYTHYYFHAYDKRYIFSHIICCFAEIINLKKRLKGLDLQLKTFNKFYGYDLKSESEWRKEPKS